MNQRYFFQFFFITILLFLHSYINAEQSAGEYLIGPGDVISIQVWDHDDLSRKVEVSQEGDFTFPLIGRVHAAGLTVFELEKYVTDKLGSGYLISPQVTIAIFDNAFCMNTEKALRRLTIKMRSTRI